MEANAEHKQELKKVIRIDERWRGEQVLSLRSRRLTDFPAQNKSQSIPLTNC